MRGYFINLQRSVDRRDHMLAQASRFPGLLERFEAVDGATLTPGKECSLTGGELGCFLSHYNLILAAPLDEYFCVFEDDVILSEDLGSILSQGSLERLANFDVVWLDCTVNLSNATLLTLWHACRNHLKSPADIDDFQSPRRIKGCEIFPAPGLYDWGAAAYVVTPRGRQRVLSVLKECLDRGAPDPYDALIRSASEDGKLDAAVLVPFLATPRLENVSSSTIEHRHPVNEPLRFAYAIRRMFFAGPIDAVPGFAADLLKASESAKTPSQLLAHLSAAVFELTLALDGFVVR